LTGGEYFCSKREILGETVDGGFAEYILGYEGHVYALPPDLDALTTAPLFCPGVTAYGAVKKAGIVQGMKVAVFGVGGVGHLAIKFARLCGADVFAVTRSDLRLDLASELGAVPIDGKKDPVEELIGLGKMDSSIVFAPSSKVAMQAIKATKARGTIVMGAPGGIEEFPFDEEKKVVSTLVGGRQAMREVLALAAARKIIPITETHRLDQANQVLKTLKRGELRARAVLVP
jgi:propanol-preferring alcohol dehydrogenase